MCVSRVPDDWKWRLKSKKKRDVIAPVAFFCGFVESEVSRFASSVTQRLVQYYFAAFFLAGALAFFFDTVAVFALAFDFADVSRALLFSNIANTLSRSGI